jgi:hypothetical protein
MIRRDHIAGGAFVIAGALILVISADLPFGTLASPGAGMLPKLVIGLMIALGAIIFLRASESPPFGSIPWADLTHGLTVIGLSIAAAAVYTALGFVVTVALLLFALIGIVERRNLAAAAIFSIAVTLFTYILFDKLLKAPLPRGIAGF